MHASGFLAYQLARTNGGAYRGHGPKVKRGLEILEGPYPKSFVEFVGQSTARSQILASITASVVLSQPMDHMLLASGQPGVGKTALARLTAFKLGAGMVELSGLVSDKDAAKALKVMRDGDVLLIDEIHRLVGQGKSRAEWLLTLMQDGELHMPTGVIVAPKITIIAATTDKERIPQTILDRFVLQPILEPYSLEEGVEIAKLQATRLGFGTELLPMPEDDTWLRTAAHAARHNPRRIGKLLSSVRDVALSTNGSNLSEAGYDISLALEWNGLTKDGITRSGQDYLMALLAYGGTAGQSTLKALLNEELLVQTERDLVQDGFMEVTPRGRTLTDYGNERAIQLANNKMEVQPA
jgi:Holliday junction resolvasome RuvABC ATP-dependent DNA helicase subunit